MLDHVYALHILLLVPPEAADVLRTPLRCKAAYYKAQRMIHIMTLDIGQSDDVIYVQANHDNRNSAGDVFKMTASLDATKPRWHHAVHS